MARFFILIALALAALAAPVKAQDGGLATLKLSAALGASNVPLDGGLRWRVFGAHADQDGQHPMIVESSLAQPTLSLPAGDYVVHVAFGLASATRGVSLGSEVHTERLALAAGALRIGATLADKPIDPSRLSLAIFVPERNNSEAKLVYAHARAGEVIGVPEGLYHIVSTYLDTVGVGALGLGKAGGGAPATPLPTNSVASGDVRVAAGKIVDVTLHHRCARLTLKLVAAPGADALANTTFTILTPGGDVIRDLVGAFPSLVLAEGEYVVVARHDAKTFQATFEVKSALDRDVEVIAKEDPNAGR